MKAIMKPCTKSDIPITVARLDCQMKTSKSPLTHYILLQVLLGVQSVWCMF